LSYSWGDPAIHQKIFTQDGVIPITASVQSALKRFRFQDRTRIIWVDAFCVNQSNNEEKSGQILLMPKIYSSASRVVVYLGKHADDADNSRSAIKLMEKSSKTSFYSLPGKIVSDSALTTVALPHGHDKVWRALKEFWARRWFRRIWIIQEFLLAKDIIFAYGDWERSWEIFLDASWKISDFRLIQRCQNLPMDIKKLWMQLLAQ
jgi:hypothetical protein